MDIGQLIKQYRKESKLSMRDFAARCGVSHSYIAMLEARKNSKTGEPIVPTISKLNKIANGMGMSVNDLIAKCDDMPISLATDKPIRTNLQLFNGSTSSQLTDDEQKWLDFYRSSDDDTRRMMVLFMSVLAELDVDDQKAALRRFLSLSP